MALSEFYTRGGSRACQPLWHFSDQAMWPRWAAMAATLQYVRIALGSSETPMKSPRTTIWDVLGLFFASLAMTSRSGD
eukprot:7991549-Pyramimonas_sp.AAC.1